MFGYFKKRRERRKRAAEIQALAENVGETLRAELDLFIAVEIAPTREAFLEVFRGELQRLDERLAEMDESGQVGRLEGAGVDYRILMENWQQRRPVQVDRAHQFLREQFDIADSVGIRAEYEAAVEDALNDQQLALMSDGLGVLLELVPEARKDYGRTATPT